MKSNLLLIMTTNRIIDLENKIKEGQKKNLQLDKEIQALELVQKNQENELGKNAENTEGNSKIKMLNEQLKTTKEKNKELEKKIQAESASSQKQHNYLLDLQEKLQQLRKDKVRWKKAIADGLPCPPDENKEEKKKPEEEVLKTSVLSLKRRFEMEKATTKKMVEIQKNEIAQYQMKIKEAEQENKLNTTKLAELKKMMRHNQLIPLNETDAKENPEEEHPAGESEAKKQT